MNINRILLKPIMKIHKPEIGGIFDLMYDRLPFALSNDFIMADGTI